MQASLASPTYPSLRPLLGLEQAGSARLRLAESLVTPLASILSLLSLMVLFHEENLPNYTILAVLVVAFSFPGKSLIGCSVSQMLRKIVWNWVRLVSLLAFIGLITGLYSGFTLAVLLCWLWLAPACQFAGHISFRVLIPPLLTASGYPKRVVIVGCNELGRHLAAEIAAYPVRGIVLDGYFDDRDAARIEPRTEKLLGSFADVTAYIKANNIAHIFLALPMASQPRILSLLEDLKDTTTSIYFVPDIFVTDLIQARIDTVGRMPVVAVCDTPFRGKSALVKRGSDIVLSIVILLLVSPLLLIVALLIRFSSPGAVIFKQRRYGLDGREITVYKFRSMTCVEDGPNVPQAQRNDPRITPIGAFIRKTSIDELPQFINVLRGHMSIVGPRPHAVAHNEMYRKVIRGYMVRHKVKPGITGWAQVNGLRGETETLDKMKLRVEHDLEYLRNWSLGFDLRIIMRTILLVFRDAKAY